MFCLVICSSVNICYQHAWFCKSVINLLPGEINSCKIWFSTNWYIKSMHPSFISPERWILAGFLPTSSSDFVGVLCCFLWSPAASLAGAIVACILTAASVSLACISAWAKTWSLLLCQAACTHRRPCWCCATGWKERLLLLDVPSWRPGALLWALPTCLPRQVPQTGCRAWGRLVLSWVWGT